MSALFSVLFRRLLLSRVRAIHSCFPLRHWILQTHRALIGQFRWINPRHDAPQAFRKPYTLHHVASVTCAAFAVWRLHRELRSINSLCRNRTERSVVGTPEQSHWHVFDSASSRARKQASTFRAIREKRQHKNILLTQLEGV